MASINKDHELKEQTSGGSVWVYSVFISLTGVQTKGLQLILQSVAELCVLEKHSCNRCFEIVIIIIMNKNINKDQIGKD